MGMLANPMLMNPIAQRLLAQSVNLSYAGRGAYRVSDTQPSRKGDYWFRDFGMVMACTYMTEMGFRGTERFYTMPLLTNALELQALRSDNFGQKRSVPNYKWVPSLEKNLQRLDTDHLYPKAFNYSEMPEALSQKMMGTLIRNSSDLVPQVLKEDALKEIANLDKNAADTEKLKPAFKEQLKKLLENPLADGHESVVSNYLSKHNLGTHQNKLEHIAQIDNKALYETELAQFIRKNAGLKKQNVQNAIRLIKTQQLGFLIHHLDRTLNFQHHLESNYLTPKPSPIKRDFVMPMALRRQNKYSPVGEMGEIVSDRLRFYVKKLDALQNQSKGKLRALAEEVRKLPLDQRDEVFSKKIGEIEDLQFLYKKESLTDFWRAMSEDAHSIKDLQEFYDQLNTADNFTHDLGKDLKNKWGESNHRYPVNWENEFKIQKDRLREFLVNPPKHPSKGIFGRYKGYISPNQLNTQLAHFEGWFETVSKAQDFKNNALDNLWRHLGADMMLQVKKKVKVAFEEVNKLSFEHLPETAQPVAARKSTAHLSPVRVSKRQLLEARLKDMGLTSWLNDQEIERLSRDLDHHLPKMPTAGSMEKSLEQHSVEPIMDKVKKTIWAHLTGTADYKSLKGLAPALAEHLEDELKKLSQKEQQDIRAKFTEGNKIRGKLFQQLTNTDAFGRPLLDALGKPVQTNGLETLLKPLLQSDNLHKIPNPDKTGTMFKSAEWTFKSLIVDGIQSNAIKSAVDKIQRNGTWPKMVATVALNFIFYGWLASRFDNKVLQPYEEKLVARKGTSRDIVNAGYLGTLPAAAVLTQLFDKTTLVPFFKQMNHFTRFAAVGGIGLGVFAGSTYGFLKWLEKKAPALPGYPQASTPKIKPLNLNNPDMTPFKGTTMGSGPVFGNPAVRHLPTNKPFSGTPFQSYRPAFSQPFSQPGQAPMMPFKPYFQAKTKTEVSS